MPQAPHKAAFAVRLAARGEARDDSDVDMLVEFEPGQTPGLLRLAEIEAELSPLFGGHPIDLRTPQDLSRHFREQVVREARVQYAQAVE